MDKEQLEDLKQRYEYESWKGKTTLTENLFIQRFSLGGTEVPGWSAHNIQVVDSTDYPSYIKSIWKGSDAAKEELLSIDIYDCDSRLAAHEFVIMVLSQFMSPFIQRREDIMIGDVAFMNPEETTIVFARANLVFSIGNVGSDLVMVIRIARQFDQTLIDKPEQTGLKVISNILAPDFVELDDGVRSTLAVEQLGPAALKRWHKLFSRSGEITREAGRLIYRSTLNESHEVEVYSVNPGGNEIT